jgi:hypothetical protein
VEGAEAAALDYGFRRVFYSNTHHYFANFYQAWFWGSEISREFNAWREVDQLYKKRENEYDDAAADILIAEIAVEHVRQTKSEGIQELPRLLAEDACASTVSEIYAGWGPPNPPVEDRLGPWQ